jgi:hypothetical protein
MKYVYSEQTDFFMTVPAMAYDWHGGNYKSVKST